MKRALYQFVGAAACGLVAYGADTKSDANVQQAAEVKNERGPRVEAYIRENFTTVRVKVMQTKLDGYVEAAYNSVKQGTAAIIPEIKPTDEDVLLRAQEIVQRKAEAHVDSIIENREVDAKGFAFLSYVFSASALIFSMRAVRNLARKEDGLEKPVPG
ncbi:MAG: hypothetical protein KDI46_08655 [Alphaproteobacteria bacterium]|nr:hypothetical protein [Alphaproteobacteria bacterium]MCB1721315.1 hypothetical protein [Alphaproteobacteria bacterium]